MREVSGLYSCPRRGGRSGGGHLRTLIARAKNCETIRQMPSVSYGITFVFASFLDTNSVGNDRWVRTLLTSSVWRKEWSLKSTEDNIAIRKSMIKGGLLGYNLKVLGYSDFGTTKY